MPFFIPRALKLMRQIGHGIVVSGFAVCAAWAESDAEPITKPTGLMWNRTGLPLVFPLQVKTRGGADYLLVLVEDQTGDDALAAYIDGGAFFKVLVPPGTYRLRFHYGPVWLGESRLFGSGDNTGRFTLDQPLTFQVRGANVKAGHLVDLTQITDDDVTMARVEDQTICQKQRTVRARPPQPLDRDAFNRQWEREEQRLLPSANAFGTYQTSDFPRYEVDPLARLDDRNLAYLRYRNGQPLYPVDEPRRSPAVSSDMQVDPCR